MYLLFPKLEQGSHGVRARGEDEDEGGAAVAVCEGLAQVKWRNLDELLAQTPQHKLLDHGDNLRRRGWSGEDEYIKMKKELACKENNGVKNTPKQQVGG